MEDIITSYKLPEDRDFCLLFTLLTILVSFYANIPRSSKVTFTFHYINCIQMLLALVYTSFYCKWLQLLFLERLKFLKNILSVLRVSELTYASLKFFVNSVLTHNYKYLRL